MNTWPNRGASGGPCGGLEERKSEPKTVRPTRSDSSQQASSKPGAVQYVKVTPVSGFTNDAISKWAKSSLLPGTLVLSDGLGCFAAVTDAGCIHTVDVVGRRKPRDLPQFKWVNTVLGNLKTMISGAYKAFKYGKYARQYFGAFAYRFNRRFDLASLVVELIVDVSRGAATPERVIRHA